MVPFRVVLARSGAADEAFGLLCQVAATEPGKPWAAGWLAMPEASATAFAEGMDPDQAATSFMRLAGSLPDPADPDLVAVLTPFLQVARRMAARNPEYAGILPLLSALARRLGAHDEAIALPGKPSSVKQRSTNPHNARAFPSGQAQAQPSGAVPAADDTLIPLLDRRRPQDWLTPVS